MIANVETGEQRQVTDGLADAMFPVWDASGKYLWFFASTDLGLRSQWLDMTSYDREENFALYLAVLDEERAEPAAARKRRRPRRLQSATATKAIHRIRRIEPIHRTRRVHRIRTIRRVHRSRRLPRQTTRARARR